MREWDSSIDSQEDIGSCAGNAIVNAYELQVKRRYPDKFTELSRLFVYYNSRLLGNNVKEDTGAYLRDGMKAIQKFGICSEKLWPYNTSKFSTKPTDECYTEALSRTITSYQSLDTLNDVLSAINDNKPVVVGITVYDSFNNVSKKNPVIQTPSESELHTGGGHAMTIVGYDLPKKLFIVKNSYGEDWGDQGYGFLPFEYLESKAFEKWTFDISDQPTISF